MALGFMRRHRRWLNVSLGLVIAAFIILYIPALTGVDQGSPGEVLGSVGGVPITVGEFQRAYLQRRQLYERLYQGRLDAAALQSLGLENQVFEGLVGERLVLLEAKRLGLSVDDGSIARRLASAPEFQHDGRFIGAAEIRRLLELQGRTVKDFEEELRRGLLREKLETLVTAGVSTTPAEVEQEFRRRNEQVKVEYVLVDAARFRPDVSVEDAEIQARFDSRKEAYRLPEKRVVSYILLDSEAQQSRVTLTDRDLEAYYQEHREDFKEEEQVCASHILVKLKSDPAAKEGHADDEARKLAQASLDQVRSGADFAAVAKKSSEDTGSAARGGDLGCFPRGRMVPEFDNAVFSLEPGQVSDLVKSPFGYHVIRVASRREEAVPALAQVKERIRQTLVTQRARALIEEKSGAIAAGLARRGTLEDAAREHGLSVQRSQPIARGEAPPPLASPPLVARAFELKAGEIESQPFALPRGYAFIALAEVQPSRLPALPEVRDRVKDDLAREKAQERSRLLAAEVKARAEKAGLEKAALAAGLVRQQTPSLVGRGQPLGELGASAALDEAVYGLPEKALSEPVQVGAGFAIVRVLERKPFDPAAFEQQKGALSAALREEKRSQLFQAYLNHVRQGIVVERRPETFRRVVG
jgi:peptidyl-prolyl cis-trans isomerase D